MTEMEDHSTRWRRMHDFLTSRVAVRVLFVLILVIGLFIARDFGISWDEKAMYVLGEDAFRYVFRGGMYPTEPGIRYHGAWFEIAQYAVQEMLGLRFARSIFIMRHMMNFVTFWICLLAIYAIAFRTFKSRPWALVTMLFLLLSPRQFGHAFFNGRDIPTMAFFTVKMLTLLLLIDAPNFRRAVLHGIASGIVISLRVGLLFLPFYTILFLGIQMFLDSREEKHVVWKRYAILLCVYLAVFAASTVAFWPLLWEDPVGHLIEALRNMLWEQQAPGGFYFGEMVSGLPWHWVPVHIISKTPLLYSALMLAGCVFFLVSFVRHPASFLRERRNILLFILWFFLPVLAVMVLGASLFDEWRHLYFIYPAMLLLAVYALRSLWQFACGISTSMGSVLRGGLAGLCVVSSVITGVWMVQNHPLQYVYFSLPSRWIEGRFELDYWGLSFRQGFEWILAHDKGDPVSVSVTSSPGWENLNILTQEERRRLVVRQQFDTKYVLDNFRWKQYQHGFPEEAKVHSIYVSGMEVLGIYLNPLWKPEWDRNEKRMEDYDLQMHFDPNQKGFFE